MKKILIFILALMFLFNISAQANNIETLNLGISYFNYNDLTYFDNLADKFNENNNIENKIEVKQDKRFSIGTNYLINNLLKIQGTLAVNEKIYGEGTYYDKTKEGDLQQDGQETITITEGKKNFELSLNSLTSKFIYDINKYLNINLGPTLIFGNYNENYNHKVTQKNRAIDQDTGIIIEDEKIIELDNDSTEEDITDLGFEAGINASYYLKDGMNIYADLGYRYLEAEINKQKQNLSAARIGIGLILDY